MNYKELCDIYTSGGDYKIKMEMRPDLQLVLQTARSIKRFNNGDGFADVVRDTVFDHTSRACQLVGMLTIDELLKKHVGSVVLLHDLPEVVCLTEKGLDSDTTSPQKDASPELSEQIAWEELAVARRIFAAVELEQYLEFEHAGDYLKGKTRSADKVSAVGVLAQLVDKCEANLFLHTSLAIAVEANGGLESNVFDASLNYIHRQPSLLLSAIAHLPNWNLVSVSTSFYSAHMEYIRRLWSGVHERGFGIPEVLRLFI